MIQRIQSVYLLVVSILFVVLLICPMINVLTFDQPATTNIFTLYSVLNILEVIIAFIALGSIFLYKKRKLQMKLVLFNIVLMVGYYALAGLFIYLINHNGDSSVELNYGIAFPPLGIILSWLAFRAIRKDEDLVRALNRIR